MSYRVLWQPVTEDDLASAYLAARSDGNGSAFADALAAIANKLANDPESFSESRTGKMRVISDNPVTIHFILDVAERTVSVAEVRYYVPRSKR